MRRSAIFTIIILMSAAWSVAPATAGEEATFTSDGGLRLTSGTEGPVSVDVATDGDATITFFWLKNDGTANAGDVVRSDPAGEFGNAFYSLRSEFPPRHFEFGASGPDSIYVDLSTASEVIATW